MYEYKYFAVGTGCAQFTFGERLREQIGNPDGTSDWELQNTVSFPLEDGVYTLFMFRRPTPIVKTEYRPYVKATAKDSGGWHSKGYPVPDPEPIRIQKDVPYATASENSIDQTILEKNRQNSAGAFLDAFRLALEEARTVLEEKTFETRITEAPCCGDSSCGC